MTLRRRVAASAALALALLLAGCSGDPLADQYREGSNKDYIAGDGTVEIFSPESRTDPVEFEGETVEGGTYSSVAEQGDVVVVNFWYAQCPPCRAEARDLESISSSADDGVQFVGVNTRDEAGTARAFEEEFGVTYPSILDYQQAGVQLAFSSSIPPNAVPTTLVLDRQGRVAARILGQVTEPSILETIIREDSRGDRLMTGLSELIGGSLLLALPVALLAGLVSFASPCVLPLVPGYLAYVGGFTDGRPAGDRRNAERRRVVLGASLFVLGFAVVFVGFGIAFGAAGFWLIQWRDLIIRIAGVVVIIMGLVFIGRFGVMQREIKPTWRPVAGLVGAPLLGAVFAIGWTPCMGPTLAAIYSLSFGGGSPVQGAVLGLAYALGLGIPFVLIALGLSWASGAVGWLRRHIRVVNVVGGIVLIVIGVLMVSGLWNTWSVQLGAVIQGYGTLL